MKAATIKLPATIQIGSQVYEVRVLKPGMADDGQCNATQKIIWVEDKPDNPRALLLNWWHEVFHGGEQEYGYKLKDDDHDSDVDRIAQVATQAMLALVECA